MERQIYILLSYTGSVLSKLISIYTRKSFSHISIGLDESLDELYSFGRKRAYNPVIAGFVQEDILNGTYKRFPKTKCAVYSLNVNEDQYERLGKEIDRFKKEQDRYGYNLIGLLGAMFNYPIYRKYNYFCSQFVSEVLSNSGINIIEKSPGLTSPTDFLGCEGLVEVYAGPIMDYKLLTKANI